MRRKRRRKRRRRRAATTTAAPVPARRPRRGKRAEAGVDPGKIQGIERKDASAATVGPTNMVRSTRWNVKSQLYANSDVSMKFNGTHDSRNLVERLASLHDSQFAV